MGSAAAESPRPGDGATGFDLSDRYRTRLETVEAARDWVDRITRLPVAQRLDEMRQAIFLPGLCAGRGLDPRSDAYRARVLDLFESLRGAPYRVEDEVETAAARVGSQPYPFSSASPRAVGENLLGLGAICLGLPCAPPARVLDLGCGWANSSLTLARAGYEVTAVDIDPGCGEIIADWAPRLGVADRVRFIEARFEDLGRSDAADRHYDAIVFFKAFHHALDPFGLARTCRNLLAPGGAVVLVAEPVHGNFYVPWGLRCDGTSLVAIVRNGWLELGFDADFLDATLADLGLKLALRRRVPDMPTLSCDVYAAG